MYEGLGFVTFPRFLFLVGWGGRHTLGDRPSDFFSVTILCSLLTSDIKGYLLLGVRGLKIIMHMKSCEILLHQVIFVVCLLVGLIKEGDTIFALSLLL